MHAQKVPSGQARRLALAILAGTWVATGPASLNAQTSIRTDGSLGRAPISVPGSRSTIAIQGNGGQKFNVPGNVFTVTEQMGRVAGANLFHSFQQFSIGTGDAALFTASTPGLQHVISRVTGGERSAIHGLLSLQAANSRPDFYLINPAGVIFGTGAQIDVPAGFHVSTAQRLTFADGFVWGMNTSAGSSLTVAAPQAFGFLGSNPSATVSFTNRDANGSPGARPQVELKAGSSLNIVAGAVQLES